MAKKAAVKTNKAPDAALVSESYFRPPYGLMAGLCYLISFISPITGVVLGAVFMPQHNPKAKEFGRNCFMLAAASFILGAILLAGFFIAGGYSSTGLQGFFVSEGYF